MATKVRQLIAEVTTNSSHPNPLISHDKLRQLYSTMLKCRLLHERARMLRKQAAPEGDHSSSIGLEATVVGAAIDLRSTDTLVPSHRDFILSYLKGVPLTAIFSQLYGRNTRSHHGRSDADDSGYTPLNIAVPASTVTAQLKGCTNIALANQREKNGNVVVAFSDEGSISLGEWHQALNSAGRCNLSIVFVTHQSDQSAGSVPAKLKSSGDEISSKAVDFGFPWIAVDANDAVAVYRVAQEAIERARCGGGPTLIEAQTLPGYGLIEMKRAHYRTTDKVEEWESGDPISSMERYLTGKGLFSQGLKGKIVAAFQRELDDAVDAAESDSCGVSA
ncbi:MAG TPA: thiamine pyrophosphate-dependent enzyme [Acidobacteriaceae bacterium]|nr:thiamine pyrophosphate-dependent enzyme [Acidobacteriaceae bacterium]